ncbi:hypothetical protein IHE55_05045 [Streptomyces pactum]|uniref:Uncharacterized protein n=1 Tax=Streptomyces pactum TaxID=68249 RepID=A0ABS0NGA0_9ACTN|nr:hypothetical protein [Streptomyces pactum]MBH5334201.1 hypothetical protein [Streptomyces pactum]
MSARSPRPLSRSAGTAPGGVDIRLPWWGIALPALAFAALLLLISGSADAHAAEGGGALSQFVGAVRHALLDQLP